MSQFGCTAVAIVLTLLFVSSVAHAETVSPLENVRVSMRAFEYDEAVEEAEGFLDDDSTSPIRRIEALALIGTVHFLQRRTDQAREVFERLIALDPGHQLEDPEIPPRVRAFFTELHAQFDPEDVLSLTLDAPENASTEGATQIEATLSGTLDSVSRVVLYVRATDDEAFEPVVMTGGPSAYSGDIAAPEDDHELDYYVTVEAPSGFVLASVGSETEPRALQAARVEDSVPVEPAAVGEDQGRRRWYRSWWFWTIVGVAVAGGTATAIVLTRPEEPSSGSMGSMQMP